MGLSTQELTLSQQERARLPSELPQGARSWGSRQPRLGPSGWTPPFLSGPACEQRPWLGQPAPAPWLPACPPLSATVCSWAHTRRCTHTHTCTQAGRLCPAAHSSRGQHPNLAPSVLVSVILQDRVQTGLSWTHTCCHLTYSDWLVVVCFYCIFIVIKPRSSGPPVPSVPSPAVLGSPPGRLGGGQQLPPPRCRGSPLVAAAPVPSCLRCQ